jgi:hypothetical protein
MMNAKSLDMAEQWARVLDSSDRHGTGGETMWAQPVIGSEWRHFLLMNSPFYPRGVSYLDVVRATPLKNGDVFQFEEVVGVVIRPICSS